jgi:hypothetical protein
LQEGIALADGARQTAWSNMIELAAVAAASAPAIVAASTVGPASAAATITGSATAHDAAAY